MERWLGYLTGNSSTRVVRNDEVDAPFDVQARISSCFAESSVTPVILPSGRPRLATRPVLIGSMPLKSPVARLFFEILTLEGRLVGGSVVLSVGFNSGFTQVSRSQTVFPERTRQEGRTCSRPRHLLFSSWLSERFGRSVGGGQIGPSKHVYMPKILFRSPVMGKSVERPLYFGLWKASRSN